MKYICFLLLIIFAVGVSAENIVTTGKIKHNGLDANGNLETIHQSVRNGAALISDWFFDIGIDVVENTSYVHKFGRNPDIDQPAGTWEAVWFGGGAYTGFNATAAETLQVFSSVAADAGALVSSGTATGGTSTAIEDTDATFITDGVVVGDVVLNDDALSHGTITAVTETEITIPEWHSHSDKPVISAGDSYRVVTTASTGAAIVELYYLLDENLSNETMEFVILNGTTPVDTAGSYRRNSRLYVIYAGSGGANAGIITSRQKTTTSNVFAVMPIGYNSTMIAAYTIPFGKTGHITSIFTSLAGKVSANVNIRVKIRHIGEVFRVVEEFSISGSYNALRKYRVPKNELLGGTDIFIEADSDTNNTAVASSIDLILHAE